MGKIRPGAGTGDVDNYDSLFQKWYLASAHHHLRPALIICILCGLSSSTAMLTFLPRHIWAGLVFFHFGFILLPMLLILALSYREISPRWIPFLGTALAISALLGTNGLIGWCYYQGVWIPYEGTMLLAFAIGMFSSLPPRRVAIILTLGWLLFTALTLGLSPEPLLRQAMNITFLLFASMVAIVTAIVMQRFLLSEYRRQMTLEELSETDPLTGLLNRRGFGKRFELARRNALRERSSLGLVLLDVDFFKHYNDHYGHEAGDLVLQKLGRVLAEYSRRPIDAATRLGGEEFGLLLHDVDLAALGEIGNNLCRKIAGLAIPHIRSECAAVVTVSVGATMLDPGDTLQQAYRSADHALYAAKSKGRNRASLADNPLPQLSIQAVVDRP